MRGDRPLFEKGKTIYLTFIPHARGSTQVRLSPQGDCHVYPACAGIDLAGANISKRSRCLPRMRGDRPSLPIVVLAISLFTPHARGSTAIFPFLPPEVVVYPACAGIDLEHHTPYAIHHRLPRMRGDRPPSPRRRRLRLTFTPHARGSTVLTSRQELAYLVYPACAGIDPLIFFLGLLVLRLPRMRGDRPLSPICFISLQAFTPHARGSTGQ